VKFVRITNSTSETTPSQSLLSYPKPKRLALAIAMALAAGQASLEAATLSATDFASLSSAINTANGNGEDDIINITGTITLTTRLPFIRHLS
jgi:hypothetical protein